MFGKPFVMFALGAALVPIAANGSQLVRLHVDQQADVYHVHVEMHIDAPAERVREILTDYEKLVRLSRSITRSKIVGPGSDGSVRVLTRFRKCVLFF